MATRAELYRKFGPKLVDAFVEVVLEEINLIRTELSLPERTGSQVVDAISDKLDLIADYDWM